MKRRLIERAIGNRESATFLFLLMAACPVFGSGFAGGTGTPSDPYQIATAGQLTAIGSDPNLLDKHYILIADIDLDPNLPGNRVFSRAVIAPDTDDSRDGFQGSEFTGMFDGQGHAISRMVIDSSFRYAGLFGKIGSNGHVSNLRLVGGSVRGEARTGASGVTDGGTGCLAAVSRGLVTACACEVAVNGTYHVGGLVGGIDFGTISACYSTGSVSGEDYVGGLVGKNDYGSISASYSTGLASGRYSVGGLVGRNYNGTVWNSFWDKTTSGRTTSAGGTGLTTAQMRDLQTFLSAGWDFLGERTNGVCEFWQMPTGGGYPVLSVFGGYIPTLPQGTGTSDDPYLLETAEDLGTVWYRPGACYRLTTDIDLSGMKWIIAVIPAFAGSFDGCGHKILGMTINGGSHLGLIGLLADGAVIHDLGIENVLVRGTSSVGGLVGYNDDGTISSCYSTGSVGGTAFVGGLVGYADSGSISASYSIGSVSGTFDVGGLVGVIDFGTVSASYSTSSVSGEDYVGGLVGWINIGTISASNSTGSVSGEDYVGGLVGKNTGSISASYSTGSVSGEDYIGGLVGYNSGSLSASYSTGSVSGTYFVGGLVGRNYEGTITGSFWDRTTSGRTISAGGTGLTTAQMQNLQTFLSVSWDFLGERTNGVCELWQMPAGGGYPVLSIHHGHIPHLPQGAGTSDSPYLLETAEDIGTVWYRPWACYRLTADIDLSGMKWINAVIPSVAGSLDGFGHKILGMTINGGGHLGLIGLLAEGAVIRDLGIEDVRVSGTGWSVGGLVGYNTGGAISKCYTTGSVSGTGYDVGGLVGYKYAGTITNSYSTCSVSGTEAVGGLVGKNYSGSISASYSTGSAIGTYWYVGGLVGYNDSGTISVSYSTGSVTCMGGAVGGLVGYSYGTISASYSTGSVSGTDRLVGGLVGGNGGTISASFWDKTTSGRTTSAGGTGLTTSQMKAKSTFLNAGWDFVNTWCMPLNSYPRLKWEKVCKQ